MPLPTDPQLRWPPNPDQQRQIEEWDAWYSGDPGRLASVYGDTEVIDPNATPKRRRFQFWNQTARQPERRIRIHMPLPADMATTSADLLFSEPPRITVGGGDGDQAKIEEMLEENSFGNTLLEGGEIAAALSGVYLRSSFDTSISTQYPIISIVHPDAAVPEWRWGRLVAVTFWRIVKIENDDVYRHLERHSMGQVEHAVYQGDKTTIGQRVPLTEGGPIMAQIALGLRDGDVAPAVQGHMTAQYVPNMRPSRRFRGQPVGRSDYEGIEGLFDALDETWSSLMRDIRLGRARLIVPQEYLRNLGTGKGAWFDVDQEVFTALEMAPNDEAKTQITPQQFEIRVEQHLGTAMSLIANAVTSAGYSGRTFGIHEEGGAATATEVHASERRSFITRGKKEAYWKPAILRSLQAAIALGNQELTLGISPDAVNDLTIEFGDSVREPMSVIADTLQKLETARAISVQTKVEMQHPDWDEGQVAEETDRILTESGALVADPSGGLP